MPDLKITLLLIDLNIISKKERKKFTTPVGLVKKIRPKEPPAKNEKGLKFLLSRYHFVKNKNPSVLKDVSERSIK